MSAWSSTLASLVVLALVLLTAVVDDGASTSARRRWFQSGGGSQVNDVLRAKIVELEKLGVTRDDVVRNIWSLRQAAPDHLRALASAPLSSWPQSLADTEQHVISDRSLLVRQFVGNRTVVCNDGSPAGFVIGWRRALLASCYSQSVCPNLSMYLYAYIYLQFCSGKFLPLHRMTKRHLLARHLLAGAVDGCHANMNTLHLLCRACK